jgi:hypothetical protein
MILRLTPLLGWFLLASLSFAESPGPDAAEWPVTEPKVTLGETDPAATAYRADVPVNIVKAFSAILQGDPKTWIVLHHDKDEWCPQEVVELTDPARHLIICQVEPTRWRRLNCKEGVPLIEAILNWKQYAPSMLEKLKPFTSERWIQYLQDMSFYYGGDHRLPLTKKEVASLSDPMEIQHWLQGTEKNPAVFKALGDESVVTQPDGSVEVQCNLITGWGAVERWTLKVKLDDVIHIKDVSFRVVYPPGTFSWNASW